MAKLIITFSSTFSLVTSYVIFSKNYSYSHSINSITHIFGGFTSQIGIEHSASGMESLMIMFVSSAFFIYSVFAIGFLEKEIGKEKINIGLGISTFYASSLYGIILTNDIFNLYVFIEIASICSYLMTAISGYRGSFKASFNYLIIGSCASCFILLGIAILYLLTGSLNISEINSTLSVVKNTKEPLIIASFLVMSVGFLVKIGVFPFCFWAIEVYKNTNFSFLGLMSALGSKVMFFALFGLLFKVYKTSILHYFYDSGLSIVYMLCGFASVILFSFLSAKQNDVKKMLSMSSLSCTGYFVICLCVKNEYAIFAAIMYCISHGLIIMGLFFTLGLASYNSKVTNQKNTIIPIDSISIKSTHSNFSVLIFAMFLALLSAMPPSLLFVSEFYLLKSLSFERMYILMFIVCYTGLMGFYYSFRVFLKIFLAQEPKEQKYNQNKKQKSLFTCYVALIVNFLLIIGMFFFGFFLLDSIIPNLQSLFF